MYTMCKQMRQYFVVRYFVVRCFKEDFNAKANVLYPVQKYVFSLCFSLSLCFRFCFLFSVSLFFKKRQYSVKKSPDSRLPSPYLNKNR